MCPRCLIHSCFVYCRHRCVTSLVPCCIIPFSLFPPLLNQSLIQRLLLSQLDGPSTNSHGYLLACPTAQRCSPGPFRPTPVPCSPSLLLPSSSFSHSSTTILILELSPPSPLFSTLSRFSLSPPQTCCTLAPRCKPCLFQPAHPPSPQPFYPLPPVSGLGIKRWCLVPANRSVRAQ